MEQGKKIHSKYTKLNKIFLTIFFIALPGFLLFSTRDMVLLLPYLVQFVILATIPPGYFILLKPTLSAADEVYDCKSYLLVKRAFEQIRINLDEIISIRYPSSENHQMFAALKINRNTKFGEEILFIPRSKLFKFSYYKNEIIDDLITRIDKAKRKNDC